MPAKPTARSTANPESVGLSGIMSKASVSTSVEDYLERIYELIEQKGYARPSDIASALGLSRPSVSAMLQRLDKLGLLKHEKYRGLTLTPQGEEVARRIQRRHVILTEFLTLLNLDRNVIARDVEGIEHHVSSPTLAKIERLVEFWEANPDTLKRILKVPPRAALIKSK